MEAPTTTHMKAAKRILRYLKGTMDYGLLYHYSNEFKLVGYCDSDWAGDIDDRKSTTGYVFFIGDTSFSWSSKKQPIVTLSTCEAEKTIKLATLDERDLRIPIKDMVKPGHEEVIPDEGMPISKEPGKKREFGD
ncbi:hypothetical protein AgCh_022789 [Apium graveolens]